MAKQQERRLPEGWQWVKLGDVCDTINYGYTASADFSITEPRFLRITDIQNGKVEWSKVPGCRIEADKEATNLLSDGDIVFARTGGTTGKSFLIKNPPRAVFASYLIRLRLNEIATPEFVYLFLQSNDYWNQVWRSARGGAQPNVNAKLLGNITFPLPPIAEQKRLVAILNDRFSTIETIRKAIEDQLEAINALPATLLRQAFNGEL